jgi:DNA-binding CsgD family transcriptional regulator
LRIEPCVGSCNADTLHVPAGCVHRATCGGVRAAPKFRVEPADFHEFHERRGVKPGATGIASLTPIERRILIEFGQGGSPGSVGLRLKLSGAAIRSHRHRICEKLGLRFVKGGVDVVVEYARNAGRALIVGHK